MKGEGILTYPHRLYTEPSDHPGVIKEDTDPTNEHPRSCSGDEASLGVNGGELTVKPGNQAIKDFSTVSCLGRPRRIGRTLQSKHRQRAKDNSSRGDENKHSTHYDSCFPVQPPDGPGTESEDPFRYGAHANHVEDCKRRVNNHTHTKLT